VLPLLKRTPGGRKICPGRADLISAPKLYPSLINAVEIYEVCSPRAVVNLRKFDACALSLLIRGRKRKIKKKQRGREGTPLFLGAVFDSERWHVYLGVEVAALLHKRADCKPKAIGQAELVDGSQQRKVVAVQIQGAHVTILMTAWWPPPSGAITRTNVRICVLLEIENADMQGVNLITFLSDFFLLFSFLFFSTYDKPRQCSADRHA